MHDRGGEEARGAWPDVPRRWLRALLEAVGDDATDGMATISGCAIEATCESGSGSFVSYDLTFDGVGVHGMARIQVGDCTVRTPSKAAADGASRCGFSRR